MKVQTVNPPPLLKWSRSGITLLSSSQKSALKTTSYGTGELIADALRQGIRNITAAIGGSATNDGGIGAMSALGFRFLDKNDKEVIPTENT